MIINPANNSIYFTLFYSLAFLTAYIILMWEEYKRKLPTINWMLLLIFTLMIFIIGTKIFTYDRTSWWNLVRHAQFTPVMEKILLGGIFTGLMALTLGKRLFGIKQKVLDAFAIVLPIGIGIQKIGCFFHGCCFGKQTSIFFGVQYPANTLPYFHHFQSGLISSNEMLSLHIHPVQLYEAIGAFLIALIVFKTRKYWKTKGNLFYFSILLYSLVRFVTEFFRDTLAHTTGGKMIWIFNQIQ